MAEPAQRVGDGAALGATQALGATEEIALWKDKDHRDTRVVDTSMAKNMIQVQLGSPVGQDTAESPRVP